MIYLKDIRYNTYVICSAFPLRKENYIEITKEEYDKAIAEELARLEAEAAAAAQLPKEEDSL